MTIATPRLDSPAEQTFGAALDNVGGDDWIGVLRNEAATRFRAQGMPHRRVEEWKYTDLRSLVRDVPPVGVPAATPSAAERELFADVDAHRITIVAGSATIGDLPEGVTVTPLTEALASGEGWLADVLGTPLEGAGSPVFDLNTALMNAGVVIQVAPGAALDRPLALHVVTTNKDAESLFVRNAIRIGEGAIVPIVATHEGPDGIAYQNNVVTHVDIGDHARVDLGVVQSEGQEAVHLSTVAGRIGANVVFNLFTIAVGSKLSRLQTAFRFDGEHSELRFSGIHLLRDGQHADSTMFVDHAVPNCASRELFKTVLDDTSRGVFQGKILVRPHAQKTDGRMMSQAVLLSDKAEMDNKPELEIYADDVQCGHGATCGQLDEDLLFYLRARGLPQDEAEALLIQAFVGEAVDAIEIEAFRDAATRLVETWLGR